METITCYLRRSRQPVDRQDRAQARGRVRQNMNLAVRVEVGVIEQHDLRSYPPMSTDAVLPYTAMPGAPIGP